MPIGIWTEQNGTVLSNALPSDTATLAGGAVSSGSNIRESGNLWMQTPAGGLAPALAAVNCIVALVVIPANAFNAPNRNVTITANGNFAANVNNKTVSIVVNPTAPVVGQAVSGGTTIASTGVVATNGSAWAIGADIVKTGALGSNTQTALHIPTQAGAAVPPLTPCQSLTLVENAPITVAIVINNATATGDATLWNFQGQWFN